MIKLLIGGSPCTYWSIAQKNNRETVAEGMGWELFKNYLIAKEKFKPDFFLYENNKSAAQAIKDQISTELGEPLMHINSALVSAQNRQRFYVFNWEVDQPEDRGIVLKDILQSGVTDKEKAHCLKHQAGNARDYFKKHHTQIVFEPVLFSNPHGFNKGGAKYGKAPTLTATGKYVYNNRIFEPVSIGYRNRREDDGKLYRRFETSGYNKSNALTTVQTDSMVAIPTEESSGHPIYEVKNKRIVIKGREYPIDLPDGLYIIRKLTPIECERLQTLPDGYTEGVSDTQRFKCLGNGWTAEIIIHILQGALANVPRDEKIVVLSMYDGIGTGRYCLDAMGFTNVEYHAYEIDKYAMKVALKNYPDIIEHGDAFALREDNWSL